MNAISDLKKSEGSATLFALFLSAVIITIAIAFNIIVRENLKAGLILKQKMDAFIISNTVKSLLLYSILSGNFTQKEIILYKGKELLGIEKIPLNGEEVELFLPERVKVSLQDTNGLLSLVYIKTWVLKNLIKNFTNGDEKRSEIIIDSLLDWIDRDDYTRLNGAEKEYYEKESYPYIPRNYEIQYKEELALIRGVDKELYKNLEPYITILPSTGFNPNTAKDEVLKAYLDIDNETLNQLKNYIALKPVSSDAELYGLTGKRIVVGEEVYFYPSRIVEMNIKVPLGEKTIYTLKAGIDLRLKFNKPYEILYFKEE